MKPVNSLAAGGSGLVALASLAFPLLEWSDWGSFELGAFTFPLLALLLLFLTVVVVGVVWIWETCTSVWNQPWAKSKSTSNLNSLPSRLLSTLRRFLPLIIPQTSLRLRAYLTACLLMLVLGRILNIYLPHVNKTFVDSLSESSSSSPFRWELSLLSAGLVLLQRVMEALHGLLWSHIEQNTSLCLQSHFFSHVHSLPHGWHAAHKTGDLFSVTELGSDGFNEIIEHFLFSITPAVLDILISVVYLSTLFNIWIGCVVAGQVLIYFVLTAVLNEYKKRLHRPMNDAARAKHQHAMDSLMNYETVKYYTNEEYECSKMRRRITEFQVQEARVNAAGRLIDMCQGAVLAAGTLLTTLICGWMVHQDECSVGDYFLFLTHFGMLNGVLRYCGGYYKSISQSLVNMEALIEVLNEEPEPERDYSPSSSITTRTPAREIAGHIEFRNVWFGYSSGKAVLKDVSFEIWAGQSLSIVGPSGEGKSTLLKLLFRFYEPSSGRILLDGRDLREYGLRELRSALGIVPQDTILFNGSLRKNIRYGRVGAIEEEVESAAKRAYIHERCLALPHKYETQVGDRGSLLSGGEKLRVTLARMFLKQPSVYLLDEATSSLDPITEKAVMEELGKAAEGRTTVVITHKLAMAVGVDKIVVMEGGRVVEVGVHRDLLQAPKSLYARMWWEQQRNEVGVEE